MHLTRIKPKENCHRYYHTEITRSLFGEWGLVREWGRIGRSGQLRTDWFETEDEAKHAQLELQLLKAKRGYMSPTKTVP